MTYPTAGALALSHEEIDAEPEIETRPTRKASVEVIPFPGAFERWDRDDEDNPERGNRFSRIFVERGPHVRPYNTQGWLLEKRRGDLVENFSYDKAGHIIERRDSMGHHTSRVVNEEGWILSETIDGNTTNFSYDPQGRVTQMVDPDGSVHDFFYNEHGDLTKTRTASVTLGDGSAPQDVVTEMDYDEQGNPVSVRRNNSDTVTYRWSGRYRVGIYKAGKGFLSKSGKRRIRFDYKKPHVATETHIEGGARVYDTRDGCKCPPTF